MFSNVIKSPVTERQRDLGARLRQTGAERLRIRVEVVADGNGSSVSREVFADDVDELKPALVLQDLIESAVAAAERKGARS